MPFAKSSARPRGSSFRQRQRRHVAFFEAMESCAGSSRLPVKDIWKYRPTVTTVTFGHLYGSLAVLDKQTIESEVWAAVVLLLCLLALLLGRCAVLSLLLLGRCAVLLLCCSWLAVQAVGRAFVQLLGEYNVA